MWFQCFRNQTGFSRGCLGILYPNSLISRMFQTTRGKSSLAIQLRLSIAVAKKESQSLLQNSSLRLLCLVIHQNRNKSNRKLFKLCKLHIWTDICTDHNEEDLCSRMHLNLFSFTIWVAFHSSSIMKGP